MPLPFQSASPDEPLSRLLGSVLAPPAPGPSLLEPFWFEHAIRAQAWPSSFDHAALGGLHAPSVGLAFACGYQASLRRLVPSLPPSALVSLAVTEKDGNGPAAIATELHDDGLRGTKVFATLAAPDRPLLVLASEGDDGERKRLRLFRLTGREPGLTIAQGPRPLFVPEITHAVVQLDGVHAEALEGDGWGDYVKPFRTLEDVHVIGAVLAYAVAWSGRLGWPLSLREQGVAALCAGRALASSDARSPAVHVAVAGWLHSVTEFLQRLPFHRAPEAVGAAWERDKALLQVASGARVARSRRAWERLGVTPCPAVGEELRE